MRVKKARSVSMRSAQAALLLTTALAWGMSAQSVGTLRGMGQRGAINSGALQQTLPAPAQLPQGGR